MRRLSRYSNFHFLSGFAGILLLLILGLSSAARAELLPIKSYTSADGLIYESISGIYQDSRGFIWFTTPVGVSRFDGYQFTNYGIEDGLYNTLMTDMVEDDRGVYWFGTSGGVVYRFDPRVEGRTDAPGAERKKFEDYKMPESPLHIHRILKTSNGAIYFATSKGLYLLDDRREGSDKFVPIEVDAERPRGNVVDLDEDAAGSLWIGCESGLVRRLSDGTMVHYEIQPGSESDFVLSLAIDGANRAWLVTEKRHLIVFNPEPVGAIDKTDRTRRKIRFSPENKLAAGLAQGFAYQFTPDECLVDGSFSSPHVGRDGKIWLLAYGKGLVAFDGREFRLYTKDNGLTTERLISLLEDSFGNLWIGTDWGAMKLSRKGFVTYNLLDGLGEEHILSLFESRDGAIYATNMNWIINRFDGRKFTSVKLNIPETPENWVSRKSLLDSAGDWWFGTRNGLYKYSGVQKLEQINQTKPSAVFRSAEGLAGNSILGVFEDSGGNVWTSFNDKHDSLTRWNRQTGEFRSFNKDDGIPEKCSVRHFREDAAGNLYFGCAAQGVLVYRQEKFSLYRSENLPTGWWISDMFVDSKGRLWVGSPTRGLIRLENLASGNPTERLYTKTDGLSSVHVQLISEDAAGKIYFVTSRGMDVLEPETGKVKQYTLADGLAAAGTGVAIRDRGGNIWIGVTRGISKFTPEAEHVPPPPPVFIGALRIAGEEHPVSALGETVISGLTLEPDQRNLQIDFYGLNLASGEALRYQYRIDGRDEDWITLPPDAPRSVYLTMEPGDYRFFVRAVTLDGATSIAPASVSFTVLLPVYKRWWFLLLLAFTIVGIIYMLYRYRLQKLIELEKVRTRIATDLHDDIGASLSKIAILSEVVHQRVAPVAPNDSQINEPLEEIAGTSRELVDSMSDIVWAINPERDHLSDLIQRMRNVAGELTEYADIGLRVHLSGIEEDADLPLGADLRREIYLIFKETVNNLVKHSAGDMAEVTFAIEHDHLVVTVKDDGKGFDASANGNGANGATRGGNGLPNMRRRAAALGGSYEIASEKGKGTTAVLRVPLQTRLGGFSLKTLYRKN